MDPGLTIGEVERRSGVPATTLRYYESVGLLAPPARVSGRRRYDATVLARLEVIGLCKVAELSLDEIKLLFADEEPGRPASRALGQAKIAEIDERIARLEQARAILAWGLRCTCPSIDACSCGIHPPPLAERPTG